MQLDFWDEPLSEIELLREKLEYLATQQSYYRKSFHAKLGGLKAELTEMRRELAELRASTGYREWENTPLFEHLKEKTI